VLLKTEIQETKHRGENNKSFKRERKQKKVCSNSKKEKALVKKM
jgi:hypothetical protein